MVRKCTVRTYDYPGFATFAHGLQIANPRKLLTWAQPRGYPSYDGSKRIAAPVRNVDARPQKVNHGGIKTTKFARTDDDGIFELIVAGSSV